MFVRTVVLGRARAVLLPQFATCKSGKKVEQAAMKEIVSNGHMTDKSCTEVLDLTSDVCQCNYATYKFKDTSPQLITRDHSESMIQ